jgi:hypothetical protein
MNTRIKILVAICLFIIGIILHFAFKSQFDAGEFALSYFAAGDFAIGIFAAGTFAIGIFSIGIFSLGIFSLGIFNIGIYSIGLFLLLTKKDRNSKPQLHIQLPQTTKKRLLITSGLLLGFFLCNAQLPNGGFENWDSTNNFIEPTGYTSSNAHSDGSFYPVSRSNDVSTSSKGNYSMRIESNKAELPGAEAFGLLVQNREGNFMRGPQPAFALKGHCTALRGALKYYPDLSDSMLIMVQFFKNGNTVSFGQLILSDTVDQWSDFKIQMTPYGEADSATILISSYYAMGPPPAYSPKGNSVLYVDDLWLEGETLSSPNHRIAKLDFSVYPNPSLGILNIKVDYEPGLKLEIMNAKGLIVYDQVLMSGNKIIDVSFLPKGIYLLKVRRGLEASDQRIIIL